MSMREALLNLATAARTSIVDGADPALMAACKEAEAALSAPDETAELREALRNVLDAWDDKSGMGTIYSMERVLPDARRALSKHGGK